MSDEPIDLNEKRKEKDRKKKNKEERPALPLIVQSVARQMIQGDAYAEPFPEKFVCCSPVPGEYIFYRDTGDRKIVEQVSREYIVDAIERWVTDNNVHYQDLVQSTKFPQMVFMNWRAMVSKISGLITPFQFADGKDWVQHRAAFTPELDRDMSGIDIFSEETWRQYPITGFLARASSPDNLCAFIGSLFFEESYIQQYLYIYGKGGGGKGALIRLINSILGTACHSDTLEDEGRFWTSSFIGKRLVVFSDSDKKYEMGKGSFKRLTGGDAIRIEYKNGATFNAILTCKYIINSNYEPVLKFDEADQRRAVVVHLDREGVEFSPKFEAMIQAPDQAKFFVEYCCYKYRQLCVKDEEHYPIPVNREEQSEFIENSDQDLEDEIFQKFAFPDDGICQQKRLKEILGPKFQRVSNNTIARVLRDRFKCTKFKASKTENGIRDQTLYYVGVERKPIECQKMDGTWGSNVDEVDRDNISLHQRLDSMKQCQNAQKIVTKLRKSTDCKNDENMETTRGDV